MEVVAGVDSHHTQTSLRALVSRMEWQAMDTTVREMDRSQGR